MKHIEEVIKVTADNERDAFVRISNMSKNGFHLLTIRDLTFKDAEITIEYAKVDLFIKKLKELWEAHKQINKE